MPSKLSARSVASLTAEEKFVPGRHTDGDGLHLHVRPNGVAAWVLRYRLHDRQRDYGLGSYPAISLAEARALARDAKSLVAQGIDPATHRREAKAQAILEASGERTFQAIAEQMISAKKSQWKSEKHAAQWTSTLKQHVYPQIGDTPIAKVNTEALLRVLRPIWVKTPETASRLRGRIEAVLDFARARGWRSGENPARWRGHLAEVLPAPRKVSPVTHRPSLPWQQVPDFVTALGRHNGMAALALEFAILTAARTGEVLGMTWREIDVEARVWTVPAPRMKAGRVHRVPLSDGALGILAKVLPLAPAGPKQRDAFVFPSLRSGRPLSDMALSMLVRGMSLDGLDPNELPRWQDVENRPVVPHGFRASFRGWTRAHGWPDHLGELALAHVDKDKVRAAYARDDLLEERREMMVAWGEYGTSGRKIVLTDPSTLTT
jgi:integrase